MKQQSPSSATTGLQAVQDQFDCLVRSLMMSTFALNLKGSAEEAQPVGGGGGNGEGGGQGKGRGRGGKGRWRSKTGTKDASRARNGLCNKDEPLLSKVGWLWCCGSICRSLEEFLRVVACVGGQYSHGKERGFDKPRALSILTGHDVMSRFVKCTSEEHFLFVATSP